MSTKFRRYTAFVTLPPVVAAVGVAIGCGGSNVVSACVPPPRHDPHVEQEVSVSTTLVTVPMLLSGAATLPPGDQELSQSTLDLWARRVERKPVGYTMSALTLGPTDDTLPPTSPSEAKSV